MPLEVPFHNYGAKAHPFSPTGRLILSQVFLYVGGEKGQNIFLLPDATFMKFVLWRKVNN